MLMLAIRLNIVQNKPIMSPESTNDTPVNNIYAPPEGQTWADVDGTAIWQDLTGRSREQIGQMTLHELLAAIEPIPALSPEVQAFVDRRLEERSEPKHRSIGSRILSGLGLRQANSSELRL
jgi:hypothetical protein